MTKLDGVGGIQQNPVLERDGVGHDRSLKCCSRYIGDRIASKTQSPLPSFRQMHCLPQGLETEVCKFCTRGLRSADELGGRKGHPSWPIHLPWERCTAIPVGPRGAPFDLRTAPPRDFQMSDLLSGESPSILSFFPSRFPQTIYLDFVKK
ncbi:unnamed protein product [Nesidiocoris tenuis]|uniref:Uncharacterized protein n=1 Tax=Nesidiocoris tenuis TaxID=355587 RepID=A0A6H5H9K6_9HEMI|nr:unnamed protein product [Nesidiocoris tenuis]